MQAEGVLAALSRLAEPDHRRGMARFGIETGQALGIPIPSLRRLARSLGRDHQLALKLWDSGVHEARILAGMVADPNQVTSGQMDSWSKDFDSWDLCDQVCNNLFDRTPLAYGKALDWSSAEPTFVKRAGFVLMAVLAAHDKQAPDGAFLSFFPAIRAQANDSRNFVKKAMDWAVRQMGKRNLSLNAAALNLCTELESLGQSAAWIARHARRELISPAVQERLQRSMKGL